MKVDEKIEENKGLVYKVIQQNVKYIPNGFEMDDLVQIGLVGLWKAIELYNEDLGSFGSHAYTYIKNELTSFIRSQQAEKRKPVKLLSGSYVESFENSVVDKIMIKTVRECLSEQEKNTICLRYTQGYSRNETAKKLGLSVRQVDRLTQKAKNKIRNELEGVVNL